MTCRCGYQFCWICRGKYVPGHYSSGSACEQFGGTAAGVTSSESSFAQGRLARAHTLLKWTAPLWFYHLWRTAPHGAALEAFFSFMGTPRAGIMLVLLPMIVLVALSSALGKSEFGAHRVFLKEWVASGFWSFSYFSISATNGNVVFLHRVALVLLHTTAPIVVMVAGYFSLRLGIYGGVAVVSWSACIGMRLQDFAESMPVRVVVTCAILFGWWVFYKGRTRVAPFVVAVTATAGVCGTAIVADLHFRFITDYFFLTRWGIGGCRRAAGWLLWLAAQALAVGFQVLITAAVGTVAAFCLHKQVQLTDNDSIAGSLPRANYPAVELFPGLPVLRCRLTSSRATRLLSHGLPAYLVLALPAWFEAHTSVGRDNVIVGGTALVALVVLSTLTFPGLDTVLKPSLRRLTRSVQLLFA
jgi:hypothetical protein